MSKTVDNAVRLVADFAVIPGTSQILRGEYKSGLIHAGVGLASRVFLTSPIGIAVWLVTAANSYAMSTSDKNLVACMSETMDAKPAEEEPAAPAEAPAP